MGLEESDITDPQGKALIDELAKWKAMEKKSPKAEKLQQDFREWLKGKRA